VVIVAVCTAAVVTLLVGLLPPMNIAERSQGAHAAIETAASLIAAVGAVILAGRFRRARGRRDLLLGSALALLATTNLAFALVPSLADRSVGAFALWTTLGGRTAGAAILAAAAFLPDVRVPRPRRALARAAVGVVGLLAAIAAVAGLLQERLPTPDPAVAPEALDRLSGPPSIVAVYAVLTAVYAAAAVGFTRQARRRDDQLTPWLAAAAAVAAFAHLNYFLFPSIGSDRIYTGDVLRLAFYLVLLTGALREVVAYQRQAAVTAVYEERRRMARDLHDGIAQDLAFIASHSHRLVDKHRPDVAKLILQAAGRALDESRVALVALARPVDESLQDALEATLGDLAHRGGASIEVDVDVDAEAEPEVREALVRIASEAVNNSVRHGGAQTVRVALRHSDALCMVVSDDGRGFTPEDAEANGGFGMTSMRERAEAVGGELIVDSAPGRGATVEVRVP
jgi:signal transduction histidine kinase